MSRFTANRRYLSDETGAATIEAVLWVPFFVIVFSLIADASLLFNAQTMLTRVVQDANRAYSVGLLKSEAETESYILARVGAAEGDPDTTCVTTYSYGIIRTKLVVPAGHYLAVGFFDALTRLKLTVTSEQVMES